MPNSVYNQEVFTFHDDNELDAINAEIFLDMSVQKARQQKLLKRVTLAQAASGLDESIYFPFFMDFRGRVYADAWGLSPQGKDMGKGLIQYAVGAALGPRGLYWLAVSVATYGGFDGMDKARLDMRADWTKDNTERLRQIVTDAEAQTGYEWRMADEPVLFLAAAREWLAADNNPDYISHLGHHVDATCSGLQILAAMSHDGNAGSMVNVRPLPSGERADIYRQVAGKALEMCEERAADGDENAQWWVNNGISRALAKRPVMTYCYSAKVRTFIGQIVEETGLHSAEDFKRASYLGRLFWDVVQELLPGPAQVMYWLQGCANALSNAAKPVDFMSSDGLRVFQANYKYEKAWAKMTLRGGDIRVIIQKPTKELATDKQSSAVAPNIVHHYDAQFLRNVVNRLVREKVEAFTVIHDSFHTRFCDMDRLNTVLREEFAALFQGNPLEDLWLALMETSGVKLPPPPALGEMNPAEILQSWAAFS